MKSVNELQVFKLRYPWFLIIVLEIFIIFIILVAYLTPNWATNEKSSIGIWNLKQGDCSFNVFDGLPEKCESLTNIAKNFKSSSLLYSLFLSIFCVFWILWLISSISFVVQKNFYRLGCVSGVGCILSLSAGVAVWTIVAKVSVNGCRHKAGDSVNYGFCAAAGFYINAWTLILVMFTQYFYVVIGKVSLKLSEIGLNGIHTLDADNGLRSIDETKDELN